MTREDLRSEVLLEMRALSTADHFMDEAAATMLGIHTTDLHAGEVLGRIGPMTIGQLARAVGLSPGAATALVDRLEGAGLASRVHDPTNRRRILVKPSARASGRVHMVFSLLLKNADTFLSRYSDEDLEVIRDFLRGAQKLMTERTAAMRRTRGQTRVGKG
ncbi:MAG TPA: MarR family transcriptional regulator [Candidatus Dormibacteraeota bacterium]|nr:MarR family transcriptional regulator [Candidatus Dormibacteraeota bacterium]